MVSGSTTIQGTCFFAVNPSASYTRRRASSVINLSPQSSVKDLSKLIWSAPVVITFFYPIPRDFVLIGTTLVHAAQSDKGNVSETDYTGQFAYNLVCNKMTKQPQNPAT
jgi:hypothetical protein